MKNFIVSASIYVGLDDYPYDENLKYLNMLHEVGIKRIFISAHMPEANDKFFNELKAIIDEANRLHFEIILDISKPTFLKFGIIHDIYSLRLDWGFDVDDILELSKNPFFIELNASTTTSSLLEELKQKGLDFKKLRVSHNFYPKPYTGLSQEDVLMKNNLFKKYGLTVMIYLPSKYGKRPPIYEGLPTIEEHRELDLLAILSEMTLLNVDEICFGDAYCSLNELKTTLDFDIETLQIPIILYEGIDGVQKEIIGLVHRNRSDQNHYFIRSSIREKRIISPFNTIERKKFAITIDNHDFLRYQGEVGIMRKDLPQDNRVNVVGYALISDFLLDNFPGSQKFKFIIRGYKECKNTL